MAKNLLVDWMNANNTKRANFLANIQSNMANKTSATNPNTVTTPNTPTITRPAISRPATINLQKAQQPVQTRLDNLNNQTLPVTQPWTITGNNPAFVNWKLRPSSTNEVMNAAQSRFIWFQQQQPTYPNTTIWTWQEWKSFEKLYNGWYMRIESNAEKAEKYNKKEEEKFRTTSEALMDFQGDVLKNNGKMTDWQLENRYPEFSDNLDSLKELQNELRPIVQSWMWVDPEQLAEYYPELLKPKKTYSIEAIKKNAAETEKAYENAKKIMDKALTLNVEWLSSNWLKVARDYDTLFNIVDVVKKKHSLWDANNSEILGYLLKNNDKVRELWDEIEASKANLTKTDKAILNRKDASLLDRVITEGTTGIIDLAGKGLEKLGLEWNRKATDEEIETAIRAKEKLESDFANQTWKKLAVEINVPLDSLEKFAYRTYKDVQNKILEKGSEYTKEKITKTIKSAFKKELWVDLTDEQVESIRNLYDTAVTPSINQEIQTNQQNVMDYLESVNKEYQSKRWTLDEDIENYTNNRSMTKMLLNRDLRWFGYKSSWEAAQNAEMPLMILAGTVAPEIVLPLMTMDSYARESQESFEELMEVQQKNGISVQDAYENAQEGAAIVWIASAAVEVWLEKILGWVETTASKAFHDLLIKDVAEKTTKMVAERGLAEMLKQGLVTQFRSSFEEWMEEILQQAIHNKALQKYDPDQKLTEWLLQSFEWGFFNWMNLLWWGWDILSNIQQNKTNIVQNANQTAYNLWERARNVVDNLNQWAYNAGASTRNILDNVRNRVTTQNTQENQTNTLNNVIDTVTKQTNTEENQTNTSITPVNNNIQATNEAIEVKDDNTATEKKNTAIKEWGLGEKVLESLNWLDENTRERIKKNPYSVEESKNLIKEMDENPWIDFGDYQNGRYEDVLNTILNKLEQKEDKRRNDIGSLYDKLEESNIDVDVTELKNKVAEFEAQAEALWDIITPAEQGQIKTILKNIQEIWDWTMDVWKVRRIADKRTKGSASSSYDWIGLIREIRDTIDSVIREQNPDMKEVDKAYRKVLNEISEIKWKLFYKKWWQVKSNAVSTVKNMLNAGNRLDLNNLEKYLPWIKDQLEAIRDSKFVYNAYTTWRWSRFISGIARWVFGNIWKAIWFFAGWWGGLLWWAVIDAGIDKAMVNLTRKALRDTITKETAASKAELERISKKIEEWKKLDAEDKARLKELGEKIMKNWEQMAKTKAEKEAWNKYMEEINDNITPQTTEEEQEKNKVTKKRATKKNKVTEKSTKSVDKPTTNEYNAGEISSSLTSPWNIRAESQDSVSRTPIATTFSFNQRDITINGKQYHHQRNENSFKTKYIYKQSWNNQKYVDNFYKAISQWDKFAVVGQDWDNNIRIFFDKNFWDHFVKHGWFPAENLVETLNNYDSRDVNKGKYIYQKRLPNSNWLRAIVSKNFTEISFFESKSQWKPKTWPKNHILSQESAVTDKVQEENKTTPIIKDSEWNTLSKEDQEKFGNSKIVDKDGNLLVVMHGSSNQETHDYYDERKAGSNVHADFKWVYFTDNLDLAEQFAHEQLPWSSAFRTVLWKRGHLYKSYVNITNPLNLNTATPEQLLPFFREDVLTKTWDEEKRLDNLKGHPQFVKFHVDMDKVEKAWYDGIIAAIGKEWEWNEYIVFKGNQAKNIWEIEAPKTEAKKEQPKNKVTAKNNDILIEETPQRAEEDTREGDRVKELEQNETPQTTEEEQQPKNKVTRKRTKTTAPKTETKVEEVEAKPETKSDSEHFSYETYWEFMKKYEAAEKEINDRLDKQMDKERAEKMERFNELTKKEDKTDAEWNEMMKLAGELNNMSNKYDRLKEQEFNKKHPELVAEKQKQNEMFDRDWKAAMDKKFAEIEKPFNNLRDKYLKELRDELWIADGVTLDSDFYNSLTPEQKKIADEINKEYAEKYEELRQKTASIKKIEEESKTKITKNKKNKVTNPSKVKENGLFNENEVDEGNKSEWLNPDALPLSDYREMQRLNDGYSLTSLSSALSKESLKDYMANKIANEKIWVKPDFDDNEAWDKLPEDFEDDWENVASDIEEMYAAYEEYLDMKNGGDTFDENTLKNTLESANDYANRQFPWKTAKEVIDQYTPEYESDLKVYNRLIKKYPSVFSNWKIDLTWAEGKARREFASQENETAQDIDYQELAERENETAQIPTIFEEDLQDMNLRELDENETPQANEEEMNKVTKKQPEKPKNLVTSKIEESDNTDSKAEQIFNTSMEQLKGAKKTSLWALGKVKQTEVKLDNWTTITYIDSSVWKWISQNAIIRINSPEAWYKTYVVTKIPNNPAEIREWGNVLTDEQVDKVYDILQWKNWEVKVEDMRVDAENVEDKKDPINAFLDNNEAIKNDPKLKYKYLSRLNDQTSWIDYSTDIRYNWTVAEKVQQTIDSFGKLSNWTRLPIKFSKNNYGNYIEVGDWETWAASRNIGDDIEFEYAKFLYDNPEIRSTKEIKADWLKEAIKKWNEIHKEVVKDAEEQKDWTPLDPEKYIRQQPTADEWIEAVYNETKKISDYFEARKESEKAWNPYGYWTEYREKVKAAQDALWRKLKFKSDRSKLYQDFVKNIRESNWNEKQLRSIAKNLYIQKVKDDFKNNYNYPAEVTDKVPWLRTAKDNYERYLKGRDTSFSGKDPRIDYSDKDRIWAWIKRQDWNQVTAAQRREIVNGVLEYAKYMGIDMKKMSEDAGVTYVHLNWKHPFLTKSAVWLFHWLFKSISVWADMESYSEKWKGRDAKLETHTVPVVMAHEITHAIDSMFERSLFSDQKTREMGRKMNDWRGLWDYWWRKAEITARMVEEYVDVMKGWEWYYNMRWYWNKDVFDNEIKPYVEQIFDEKFNWYKLTAKERNDIKLDEAPKSNNSITATDLNKVTNR